MGGARVRAEVERRCLRRCRIASVTIVARGFHTFSFALSTYPIGCPMMYMYLACALPRRWLRRTEASAATRKFPTNALRREHQQRPWCVVRATRVVWVLYGLRRE